MHSVAIIGALTGATPPFSLLVSGEQELKS
jgi:hypothetical protein